MSISDITTRMTVIIKPEDLGPTGYIEDSVYLRWVQAVVIKHWERFAPTSALANTLWIAVRHKIALCTPGGAEAGLTVRTQIDRLKGVRAVFTTVFCRDLTVLAKVESTWVALDATTKQPKALETEVVKAFQNGCHDRNYIR